MADLAKAIAKHLRRFEADPKVNVPKNGGQLRPFYLARAWYPGGRYVGVGYISFQPGTFLDREQAARYLAWLDAGNVGKHWDALQSKDRRDA
jgi:hypothetical protein